MLLVPKTLKGRVILGLMTFGPDEKTGARITSIAKYNECLEYFQSQMYNEVDTARIYVGGQQEAFSREARWKERGLKLATKCYPYEPGMHSRDRLKATCDKSLSELAADCVDIYYLHAPDRSVPFKETLEACNELHKEGKFVELGLSNFAAWEVAEIVVTCRENGWVQPTVYQAMYNAITRSIELELIPCCRKYGLSIVIYNPLAGGLFSGKYTSRDIDSVPDEGRYSNTASIIGKMYRDRYFRPETLESLRMVESVAQQHNLTLLEIALRWCVHHSKLETTEKGGSDGIIIGVSSIEQLKENLRDLESGPLPSEVVEVLDKAWAISRGNTPLYWR